MTFTALKNKKRTSENAKTIRLYHQVDQLPSSIFPIFKDQDPFLKKSGDARKTQRHLYTKPEIFYFF